MDNINRISNNLTNGSTAVQKEVSLDTQGSFYPRLTFFFLSDSGVLPVSERQCLRMEVVCGSIDK